MELQVQDVAEPCAENADRLDTVPPLRVIVADDDAMSRRVLRDTLQEAGITVIATAANGREAVELSLHYRPDVVVMDLVMPGMDGLEATRALLAAQPDLRVLVLSSTEDEELGLMSIRSGAVGFLCKSVALEAVPRAIASVARGEAVISRRLTLRLMEATRRISADGAGVRPVKSPLTPREWEVLDLLCEGRSTEDIADALVLSPETVRSHIKNILRKLGVRSRADAVAKTRGIRSMMVAPAEVRA
jgi:NarL family two-component system response regulator LiaR